MGRPAAVADSPRPTLPGAEPAPPHQQSQYQPRHAITRDTLAHPPAGSRSSPDNLGSKHVSRSRTERLVNLVICLLSTRRFPDRVADRGDRTRIRAR